MLIDVSVSERIVVLDSYSYNCYAMSKDLILLSIGYVHPAEKHACVQKNDPVTPSLGDRSETGR